MPLSAVLTSAVTVGSDIKSGAIGSNVPGLFYNSTNGRGTFNSACGSGSGYQFVIISTALGTGEFNSAYNTAKNGGKKVGVLAVNIGWSDLINNYLNGKQIDLPIFYSTNNNVSADKHTANPPGGYYGFRNDMNSKGYICGFMLTRDQSSGEYTMSAGWSASNDANHEIFFPDSTQVNNWSTGWANVRSTKSMNDWKSLIEDQNKNGFAPKYNSVNLGDHFYAYINVIGNEYDFAKTLMVNDHGPNNGGNDNNVVVGNPNYTDNTQVWEFQHVGDDYYKIKNVAVGEYINVNNSGTADMTKICTAIPSNTESGHNYMWRLLKAESNVAGANVDTYYLKPKYCVDQNLDMDLNIYGTEGKYARLCNHDGRGNTQFYIYKINEVYNNALTTIRCRRDIDTNKNGTCMGLQYVSDGTSTNVTYRTYQSNTSPYITAEQINAEQRWRFERTNPGENPPTYRIKHEGSGKYLTVDVGSNEAGKTDNVIIADRNDDDASNSNQKWLLLGDGIDKVNIVSVHYSNRAYSYYKTSYIWASRGDVVLTIDTPDNHTATGDNIQLGASNFENAQKFEISYERYAVDKGDFYSPIISEATKNNQKYAISVSLDGNNDYEANPILMRKVSGSPAVDQMWYFEYKGDGTYVIHNMANGFVLDVPSGNVDNVIIGGNSLQTYFDNNNTDAQRWYVVQEANGNYSLSPKKNFQKVIDIPNCNAYDPDLDGKDLKLYEADPSCNTTFSHPTFNKRWTLTVDTKDSPAWGENLGDTFWAYISPTSDSNKYLHCGDTYEPPDGVGDAVIYCRTAANDFEKKKQENYWKFERKADGSYMISSCNVQNSYLDKRKGNGGFNEDLDVSIWSSGVSLGQRWFIRKYDGGYHIESKLDGKVITLQDNDSIKAQTPDSANTSQLFNIIKTDLAINSDMPNIKMRLFNYGRAINKASDAVLPFFNGARSSTSYVDTDDAAESEKYDMGDFTPDMKKTLVNGYPYVTNNKRSEWNGSNAENAKQNFAGGRTRGSLKYLFDESMGDDTNGFVKGNGSATSYKLSRGDANYKTDSDYQSQCFMVNNPSALFKKNEKNGLYYYDSLLNAASFERDSDSSNTGNFKLYDYTMSVPGAGYPYKLASAYSTPYNTSITGISVFNGNFYPFNIAHEEGDLDYGELINRQKVSNTTDTNGYYVKNGEYAPVNYSLDNSAPIDCWFGMTLECEFEQTSDGTYNGKDVQFNFDGDDDVWVYVDGVLVLNIGGTHGAKEGTINFKSGTVTDPTGTTTLRALYDAAKNDTEEVDGQTVITQEFINENFNGNTFKKDTKHTLNFYYMERGGVVSSAKINFNLPKGTPSVTKEVDYSDPNFNDKRDYKFKIERAIPDGSGGYTYQNFSDVTYLLEGDDGTSVDGNILAPDGIFTLKPGQTAYFHNIDDGTQFIVTELYDLGTSKTTAQYTKSYIDENGNRVTDDSQSKEFTDTNDRVVGPYTLQTNVEQNIKFTNTLKTAGLDVSKKVYVYNNDTDKWDEVSSVPGAVYNFGLLLYTKNGDGTIEEYGKKYFSIPGDDLTQELEVDKLPVGVLYKLWEYIPNDVVDHRYVPPEFEDLNSGKSVVGSFVKAGGTAEDSDGISGEVVGDKIHIKVTNKYALRKNVVFVKTDDKQSADVGEKVNYTITSEVPDTTGFTAYTYLITDTMSSGLTFNKNVKVTIGGTEVTSACTVTYNFDNNANKFTVSVPVMNYSFGDAITVTYSAVVNANAAAKIENNSATLTYSNTADSTATTESCKTQVYSAKIVIDKYSADTSAKLSGAEFYMYKLDGSAKKYYCSNGNSVSWVDSQTSATKKTTDDNGATSFDGVADGTYYLEEVKAPDGYSRLTQATSVTVNGGGDNPDAAKLTVKAEIPNYTGPELPMSGGMTPTLLFLVGGLTALGAAVFLVAKRRTNKHTH